MHNRKGTGGDIMNNKVLFISFDSLRSDYVAGPNKKVNLPNLDSLCKNGVFFKNTIVQVPLTVPSHTSMFTGMYPFNHGIRDQVVRTNYHTPTIFDILKYKDFKILGFSDVDLLKDLWFFNWNYSGECNLKEIKSKLKEIKNQNFFIFIHYWGTHTPYQVKLPPKNIKDIISRFILVFSSLRKWSNLLGKISTLFWLYRVNRIREMVKNGDNNIVEIIKEGYIKSIKEADKFVGDIREMLSKIGILDDTLIVITADHGESFNEHEEINSAIGNEYEHGLFLYDNVLKVPLIFYQPSKLAPAEIATPIREIDIVPTILEMLGMGEELITLNFDGCSLIPLLGKNANPKRTEFIYSEVVRKIQNKKIEKRSLRSERYKLIIDFIEDKREFYDLKKDPDELNNIYNRQKTEIALEMENILEKYRIYDKDKLERERVKSRIKKLKLIPTSSEKIS